MGRPGPRALAGMHSPVAQQGRPVFTSPIPYALSGETAELNMLKNFEDITTHPNSIHDQAGQIMARINMRTVDNPIISKTLEVEFGLGGPALRSVIHALRETGHPICSSSKGYFIGSREDVLSTIESLDQRARSIQSTVDGLRLSLKRINVKPSKLEQMEMF